MDSNRQQKFARIIQKELSDIFTRDGRDYFGSNFVTISGIRTTPDLGIARVYISAFKTADKEALLEQIRSHTHAIRGQLGNRMRNQIRHIPNLEFFLDETLDEVDKMDKIFRNLDIPPETPGVDDETYN